MALLTTGPGSRDDRWPLLQRVRWRFVLLNLVAISISPINLGQLSQEPGARPAAYMATMVAFGLWVVGLYRRGGRGVLLNVAGPALVLATGVTAGHYAWAFAVMYMALFLHSLFGSRSRALLVGGLYLGAYETAKLLTVGAAGFAVDELLSNALAVLVMAWVMVELAVSLRGSDESARRDRQLAAASRRLLQAGDTVAVAQAAAEGLAELAEVGRSANGQISVWRHDGDDLVLVASHGAPPSTRRVPFVSVAANLVADYRSSKPIRLSPQMMQAVQAGLGLPTEVAHGLAVPLTDGTNVTGLLFLRTATPLSDDILVALQRFTDEVSLADRAARRNHLLAEVLANSADGIVLVDELLRLVFISPSVEELLGRQVPAGTPLGELLTIGNERRPLVSLAQLSSHAGDVTVVRADGTIVEVEATSREVDGEGTVLNVRDVSRQRRLQEEIRYRAFHDPVTGIANRTRFIERLEQALPEAARTGGHLAVALLDLDDFKAINDRRGHHAGDRVLAFVARRIGERVRDTDLFARLGGDEFGLMLAGVGDLDVRDVLEQFVDKLREPLLVDGQPVTVSASCGVVVARGEQSAEDVLRDADLAMYAAKAAGRGGVVVFDSALRDGVEERRVLRDDLQMGIARDELRVHYQPVLELATQTPVGVEALVRWQHPSRGLLFPDAFVPIAEDSGLIGRLGSWVLLTAIRDLRNWIVDGLVGPEFQMHVNLSAHQLTEPDLVADVRAALQVLGVCPERLVLEITETALAANPEVAEQTLCQLRGLGITIAIDDFGTGYASFTYLRRFPVGVVKIDRSFVTDVAKGPEESALARAIVRLAQSLGMTTVAEGIEDEASLRLLERWGCDHGQGWLWSKAMPAAELVAWLQRQATAPAAGFVAT